MANRTVNGRYLSRNFGWSADVGKTLAIIHSSHPNWFVPNLHSKHFRGVGEQRKTQEQEKWCESYFSGRQNIEDPIPWSFFASRPHGNACYAG